MNPTLPGDTFDSKEMILDMLIKMNSNRLINLEMQVVNRGNWPERTVNYLFRMGDRLKRGEAYSDMDSLCHIGILGYTLFPEEPEFLSTMKLQNIKTHSIFTDAVEIHVIDLTKIDLATEEDKKEEIDKWAMFFNSRKWEELQKLAENSDVFKEAGEVVYSFTYDDRIRKVLEERAHMDRIYDEQLIEKQRKEIHKLKEEWDYIQGEKEKLQGENEQLQGENEQLQGENEQLQGENEQLQEENAKLLEKIKELEKLQNKN